MRRDTFIHGAWMKGRIYEDRCDLSPDGSLLLYFALKGSPEFSTWTAISRLPWLHAVVGWSQMSTWGGGGRFIDNKRVALRGIPDPPTSSSPLVSLKVVPGETPYHSKSGDVPDSDWCGKDHKGCIIFTRAGQLFRRENKSDELVADFTDLTPDPQPPPEWATRPL